MSNNKLRIYLQITVVIILIVIGIIGYRIQKSNEQLLSKNHRYTIGKVTDKGKNFRSSDYFITYTFLLNGRIYKESMKVKGISNLNLHKEYIVMYHPKNPSNSEILLDMPVVFHPLGTDTGWSEIPEFVIKLREE